MDASKTERISVNLFKNTVFRVAHSRVSLEWTSLLRELSFFGIEIAWSEAPNKILKSKSFRGYLKISQNFKILFLHFLLAYNVLNWRKPPWHNCGDAYKRSWSKTVIINQCKRKTRYFCPHKFCSGTSKPLRKNS